MSKTLNFLQRQEVKANVGALVEEHLAKNQMPMLIVSWNPADPSEVSSWRDTGTDPQYVKHVLEFLISTMK